MACKHQCQSIVSVREHTRLSLFTASSVGFGSLRISVRAKTKGGTRFRRPILSLRLQGCHHANVFNPGQPNPTTVLEPIWLPSLRIIIDAMIHVDNGLRRHENRLQFDSYQVAAWSARMFGMQGLWHGIGQLLIKAQSEHYDSEHEVPASSWLPYRSLPVLN